MSWRQTVYNSTDGQIDFGVNETDHSIGGDVGHAVGNYMTDGFKTNENTLYYNERMIEKTASMISLVAGSFAQRKTVDTYNNVDEGYLKSIGIGGTQKQTAFTNMVNTATYSASVVGASSGSGPSSFVTNSMSSNPLTKAETAELMASGSFTRNVGGTVYSYMINNVTREDLRMAYHQAEDERKHNFATDSAVTRNEKIRAVNEYRSVAMNHLSSMGIDIGGGTVREVNRKITELDRIIADPSSSSAAVRTAKAQKEELEKYRDSGLAPNSEREKTRDGNTGGQNYAGRILANNLLGQDMMTGITFYRRIGNITAGAARGVMRAAVSAGRPLDALAYLNKDNRGKKMGELGIHKRRAEMKARAQARKNGTLRDFDAKRRNTRRLERDKTRKERVTKRNDRERDILNGSNTRRADRVRRRQKRRERNDKARGALSRAYSNTLGRAFRGVVSLRARTKNFISNLSKSRLVKFLRAPGTFFNGIFNAIQHVKKVIIKYLIMILGGFLLVCLVINGIIALISYIMNFLTADKDDTNYVQMIVDEVSLNLNEEFIAVAKADAEQHYMYMIDQGMISGDIESPNYDWIQRVDDGFIRDVYATEDGVKVSSTSANLLPIVSMMHNRCFDEIDYHNYTTAKAYVYYLYVQTHHVRTLGGSKVYNFKTGTTHDKTLLYKDGESVRFNPSSGTVTRPCNTMYVQDIEVCKNIYVHGYAKDLSQRMNKKRAAAANLFQAAVGLLLGDTEITEGLTDDANKANGIFIDNKPTDSKGTCDNVAPFKWKDEIYYDPTTQYAIDNNYNQDVRFQDFWHVGGCPGIHAHNSACATCICPIPEHDHSSGCNSSACTHPHDTSCCKKCKNGDSHTTHDTEICSHVHTSDCCSITPHTHGVLTESNFPDDDAIRTGEAFMINGCSYQKTCTRSNHKNHTPWSKNEEEWSRDGVGHVYGCYKTAYVCKGHCGGHITPIVDVAVDMTFEKIASFDGFKMVHFIDKDDFDTSKGGLFSKKEETRTIEQWKKDWNALTAAWFVPFPSSPGALIDTWAEGIATFAKDLWGKIKSCVTDLVLDAAGLEGLTVDQVEDKEDVFNFEGWYDEGGVLNESKIQFLKDIYGDYYDENYKDGYQAWKDFQVSFPIGRGIAYNTADIDEMMANFTGLTEPRLKVIRTALELCGKYSYECSEEARKNGVDCNMGRTESSGFVCHVLNANNIMQPGGHKHDKTPRGFKSMSTRVTYLTPGDIISVDYNTSELISGHVAIYLGTFDGPDGKGIYIVDCSAGTGYSALRKIKNLYDFVWVYRPY